VSLILVAVVRGSRVVAGMALVMAFVGVMVVVSVAATVTVTFAPACAPGILMGESLPNGASGRADVVGAFAATVARTDPGDCVGVVIFVDVTVATGRAVLVGVLVGRTMEVAVGSAVAVSTASTCGSPIGACSGVRSEQALAISAIASVARSGRIDLERRALSG
jgi:hypothetical protein